MKDKVGREFDAFVTGVASFGLFVTLQDFFVEGLVPVSSLGDDFYVYEQKQHRLRGRSSGRIYRLGDPLRVQLKANRRGPPAPRLPPARREPGSPGIPGVRRPARGSRSAPRLAGEAPGDEGPLPPSQRWPSPRSWRLRPAASGAGPTRASGWRSRTSRATASGGGDQDLAADGARRGSWFRPR